MTLSPQKPAYVALDDDMEAAEQAPTRVWSAEEVSALRARQPRWSPWRTLGWQCLVGGLLALVVGVLGSWHAAVSVAWGVVAVVVPGAVFARGMTRSAQVQSASAVLVALFVSEALKLGLTLLLLVLAPQVIRDVSWPALVAGFVVTLKVYGWFVWTAAKRRAD